MSVSHEHVVVTRRAECPRGLKQPCQQPFIHSDQPCDGAHAILTILTRTLQHDSHRVPEPFKPESQGMSVSHEHVVVTRRAECPRGLKQPCQQPFTHSDQPCDGAHAILQYSHVPYNTTVTGSMSRSTQQQPVVPIATPTRQVE